MTYVRAIRNRRVRAAKPPCRPLIGAGRIALAYAAVGPKALEQKNQNVPRPGGSGSDCKNRASVCPSTLARARSFGPKCFEGACCSGSKKKKKYSPTDQRSRRHLLFRGTGALPCKTLPSGSNCAVFRYSGRLQPLHHQQHIFATLPPSSDANCVRSK